MDMVKKYADDAGLQAANWQTQAVRHIDERFGEGFARANPALVAAMVQSSALNFHASWGARALDDHGLALGS